MPRRLARRAGLTALTGVAAAVALLAAAMPASAAPGDGSAYAAKVDVTLLGASAVTVGPLSPSNTNGPTSATLASISVPGILSTGIVSSKSVLDENTGVVHTEASIANAKVTLGTAKLTADVIGSHCDATQSGVTGGSTLVNVQIPGAQVPVNPAPNTKVNVLGLLVITFNEQIDNADGSKTINAVHIKLNALVGSGDVILASSTCGPAAPPMPMASGAGLWVGLGLLGLVAVPAGTVVLRKRRAAAQA
ncbi:choice-of-anchor P family protein [Labedaea rhizosphaerae]|uniref:LPXTG-motif cell wall-anchored protein n=1 Tax=Labedaea rhizosphaerae TaxID=598644 RepID=A0A4R6S9J1_LABRH|nr:choice-of-anchor P family protein [Labedaea rhizosphaerae]TDP96550.1 hypothetical protein EV186_104538 [Labedaea rhizosphaerae]